MSHWREWPSLGGRVLRSPKHLEWQQSSSVVFPLLLICFIVVELSRHRSLTKLVYFREEKGTSGRWEASEFAGQLAPLSRVRLLRFV